MDRNDIINMLNKYNLDKSKYMVVAGSAMTLLGVKERTNDIDLAVTQDYYDYLLQKYNCKLEITNAFGVNVYFIDDVISFSTSYYTEDKDWIDGIPIQKVEDIIKLKRGLNRPKDLIDIEILQKFLDKK